MTVVLRISGVKEFNLKARDMSARIAAPEPALELIATDVMRVIGSTFTGQGRRFGGSWQALSPGRVRYKASHGLDPRILIATGALMRSYSVRGDENQQLEITPSGITLGSSLGYGAFAQRGSGNNPKREFISFYPQDVTRWATMIKDYIMRAAKGKR